MSLYAAVRFILYQSDDVQSLPQLPVIDETDEKIAEFCHVCRYCSRVFRSEANLDQHFWCRRKVQPIPRDEKEWAKEVETVNQMKRAGIPELNLPIESVPWLSKPRYRLPKKQKERDLSPDPTQTKIARITSDEESADLPSSPSFQELHSDAMDTEEVTLVAPCAIL